MNKIIYLLAVCIIAPTILNAQDSNIVTMRSDTTGKLSPRDYVGMRGAIMMLYKSGDSIAMTSVITLREGTVIKQDGSFTRRNGSSGKLKEGEVIYMDGVIRPRNMQRFTRKDSTGN
jgi:hypothetical protein